MHVFILAFSIIIWIFCCDIFVYSCLKIHISSGSISLQQLDRYCPLEKNNYRHCHPSPQEYHPLLSHPTASQVAKKWGPDLSVVFSFSLILVLI